MKLSNRFIYGILSIILAAVIAFIAIPAIGKKTSATVPIVRITAPLERGEIITSDVLEQVEVGGYNLPANVAGSLEDVVGTYAMADLFPGDYILSSKVSSSPLSSDLALNDIPDGHVAISITTRTLASSLSDKLLVGDIVRLYHYNDKTDTFFPVEDVPELRFVKVLSVSDADGLNVDYTKEPAEGEERQQTATITVLATPEQALLLTQYENEGILHVTLVSRGSEDLSAELLLRQKNILMELYGIPTDDIEETVSPTPGDTALPDMPPPGDVDDIDTDDSQAGKER